MNQRKQRAENITGERPSGKETKSQRKRRQRLERQAEEAEKRLKICEQNPKRKTLRRYERKQRGNTERRKRKLEENSKHYNNDDSQSLPDLSLTQPP